MLDVNVLVAAMVIESPHHELTSAWLENTLAAGEIVAITAAVAAGVVRVVTHKRVFQQPLTAADAVTFLDELLALPNVTRVDPGNRNWHIFSRLCREQNAKGAFVSDIAHAATAIEHGATWVSFDRDFARFDGLRWELPHTT